MPDAPQDLPPPSPELVAERVLIEAIWRTLKPKQRLAFQKSIVDVLSEMDEAPLTMRPAADHAALKASRERAKVWLSRVMRDVVRNG